jgi:hypothetical protein
MMTDEQDATKETVRRAADAAISNRNLAKATVAERKFTQWAMASLVRLGRRVSNALVRAARGAASKNPALSATDQTKAPASSSPLAGAVGQTAVQVGAGAAWPRCHPSILADGTIGCGRRQSRSIRSSRSRPAIGDIAELAPLTASADRAEVVTAQVDAGPFHYRALPGFASLGRPPCRRRAVRLVRGDPSISVV